MYEIPQELKYREKNYKRSRQKKSSTLNIKHKLFKAVFEL